MNKIVASFSILSFIAHVSRVSISVALVLAAFGVCAQISDEDLRLPISMESESSIYDGKSSMLVFKSLRLTQGGISVKADDGRATKLDFADSVWQFSGNVTIDTGNGHIECDTADLSFTDHQLASATISGTPATFELHRPEDKETTYAEAGRLHYDFKLAVVEFSEGATITEGGNQISSHHLVYNIAEQRINAQSAGKDGDRVKITFTPSGTESPTPQDNSSLKDLDGTESLTPQDNPSLKDLDGAESPTPQDNAAREDLGEKTPSDSNAKTDPETDHDTPDANSDQDRENTDGQVPP